MTCNATASPSCTHPSQITCLGNSKREDEDRTFTSGADVHSYNTRHKKDLRQEKSFTTRGLLRSGCVFVKDWNALPTELRETENLAYFRKALHAEVLR